jgi:hypothetical protein
MHLFVMFMKKKSLISLLVLVVTFGLFLVLTTPQITKPLTIVGFFVLLVLTIANAVYLLLIKISERTRRVVWSTSFALYIGYLVALGSLRLFTLSQFLLATVALGILLFIVERSYAR